MVGSPCRGETPAVNEARQPQRNVPHALESWSRARDASVKAARAGLTLYSHLKTGERQCDRQTPGPYWPGRPLEAVPLQAGARFRLI